MARVPAEQKATCTYEACDDEDDQRKGSVHLLTFQVGIGCSS